MSLLNTARRFWRSQHSQRSHSCSSCRPRAGFAVGVSAREVSGLRTEGVTVVDVREPAEWSAGHIRGSRSVPLDVISPALLPSELPIVLVCRTGHRAHLAARLLAASGLPAERLFVLTGGLDSWRRAALPLVNRDELAGRLV